MKNSITFFSTTSKRIKGCASIGRVNFDKTTKGDPREQSLGSSNRLTDIPPFVVLRSNFKKQEFWPKFKGDSCKKYGRVVIA